MKNFKLHKSAIILSGVMVLSLCGCSKKQATTEKEPINTTCEEIVTKKIVTTVSEKITTITTTTNATTTTTTPITTTYTETQTTSNDINSSYQSESSDTTYTSTVPIYSEKDKIILDKFAELGNDIKNNIDSSELLEKGKKYFIYCVDFLFYDGEIKGIKFNDLSDKAKQQLLNDISTIDSLICTKFPNYKENISEESSIMYSKASDIIKKGASNLEEFSKDKLGEENYNTIVEEFKSQNEQDLDTIKDLIGNGKKKVKNWYEGLK